MHTEHQVFQLLVYFDFSKEDWYNYPKIVRQKTLLYGGILSETILELAIRRAAKAMREGDAKQILIYQHLVDNILTSTRTLNKTKIIALEIFSILAYRNLNLKKIYDTTKDYAIEWSDEDTLDILFGYKWNRVNDMMSPNVTITHGKKRRKGNNEGSEVLKHPVKAETVTRDEVLSYMMQAYDPLGHTTGPFLMGCKLVNRLMCQTV